MTTNLIFVLILVLLHIALYTWGFRHLSEERWQFIGAIPLAKDRDGLWRGLNLTYYGLFNAFACTLAVAMVYILLAASGLNLSAIHLVVAATLLFCVPAAKLVARWVEKKAHTFSIGGAAFVGLVATPWILLGVNRLRALWGMAPVPILPVLAAIAIAYALGRVAVDWPASVSAAAMAGLWTVCPPSWVACWRLSVWSTAGTQKRSPMPDS